MGTFKKNGTDPTLDRKAVMPGLPGGPAWSSFVSRAAKVVEEFVESALGMSRAPAQPEEHLRYRKSRGRKQRPKRRPNRLLISKRVRAKHRKAAR